jgi:hypothetical protein
MVVPPVQGRPASLLRLGRRAVSRVENSPDRRRIPLLIFLKARKLVEPVPVTGTGDAIQLAGAKRFGLDSRKHPNDRQARTQGGLK